MGNQTEVGCQGCGKRLTRHCAANPDCLWLECMACQMIIGPKGVIFFGMARKRLDEAQRRQNGV